VTVVFFWSAAARAVAPSAPMSFPAAGQHTRDPEPKSAPHDSKPKHTRKGSSHENARGPTLLAGRAQPEARGRAKALSPSLPAHWARLRGGPRPWAQAVPQPLHPPRPSEHACALWRTTLVTVVFFSSAAARAVAPASPMLLSAAEQHTRDPEPKSALYDSKPKHAHKGSSHENARGPTLLAGRAQPEARDSAKSLSLSSSAHRARLHGNPRPLAQASLIPATPAVTGHARAPERLSDVAPS
jgi:hypothetical protein